MGQGLRRSAGQGKQYESGLWSLRCVTCLLALCGEGSEKILWLLPSLLSGGKLPSRSALIPDNSVPPYVVVPFKQAAASALNLSKSVCRPLKRNFLGYQKSSVSISLSAC